MMKKGRLSGRLIPMALTVALMIPPISVSAAASDIKGHWAESVITQWQNKGLIKGYADGTIRPNGSIKRSEVATLVNQAMGYSGSTNISFRDVGVGRWYYGAAATAVWAGYMSGYPDGTFRPDATVNRAEAAAIIANVAGLGQNEATASYFSDYAAIPKWARGSIGAVVDAGLMSGYPDGSFGAKNQISRAEMISSLDRAIDWKASAGLRAQQQAAAWNSSTGTTGTNSTTSIGSTSSSIGSTLSSTASVPAALMEYYNLLYPSTGSTSASVNGGVSSSASSSSSSNKVESLVVREDGEKIKNKTITGDLIIDEDVDDGTVYIENTTIEGDLVIEGGGEDSVYVTDTTVDGKVIMKKKNVHLELSGDTRIKTIELRENGKITEDDLKKNRSVGKIKVMRDLKSGKSTTIDVPTDKIIVEGKCSLILKSDVEKLEINEDGEDSTIEIKSGTTVDTVTANAPVSLKGSGTIGNLEVCEDGVDLDGDLDVDDMDVDSGVSKPTIDGKKDDEKDDTEKPTKTELTKYTAFKTLTVDTDLHLTTKEKAAAYLLDNYKEVTLTYGENGTVKANISAWDCKDYQADKTGKYTFTATYALTEADKDKYEAKATVTVELELKVAQTAETTTSEKTELTKYQNFATVTVDTDLHLTTKEKAAAYLLDKYKEVTLTYGENGTVKANISAWDCKDYQADKTGKYTFTATYALAEADKDKYEAKATVTVELELKAAQTAETTPTDPENPTNPPEKEPIELTGYTAFAPLTIDENLQLVDEASAAKHLLEQKEYQKVTLQYDTGTVEANISAWTLKEGSTYQTTASSENTFTATYTMPEGYQDEVSKFTVEATLKLEAVQSTDTTPPQVQDIKVTAEDGGNVEVEGKKLSCAQGTKVGSITVTMDEAVQFAKDKDENTDNKIQMSMSGQSIGKDYGTFTINGTTITITPYADNKTAAYVGTVTFTVPKGVLQDAVGNTTEYTFTLEVKDVTPPQVKEIKVSNSENATFKVDVPQKTISCLQNATVNTITVTMDEEVFLKKDANNQIEMKMEGNVSVSGIYGTFSIKEDKKTIEITPSAGNKTAAYVGTVTFTVPKGVLQDAAGNTTAYEFKLVVSPVQGIKGIAVMTRAEALERMFVEGQATIANDGKFKISASELENNKITINVTADKNKLIEEDSDEKEPKKGRYMGMAFVLTLPDGKTIEDVSYGASSDAMGTMKKEDVIKEETVNKYKEKTFMFYLNANDFTDEVKEVKRYIKLDADTYPTELIFTFTDTTTGNTEG